MEKYLLILLVSLGFAGCAPYADHWKIIKGNYDFINGRYQSATVEYLGILEKSSREREVVHYNLGNVFYALGETAAADEEWTLALEGSGPDLRFRTLFNHGNLYYELSQYEQAYESFRQALVLNPDSRDAKRNLELALQKLGSQKTAAVETTESRAAERTSSSDEEVDRILNYIKRKEESRWVSQKDRQGENSGPSW